jgi:mevalonate kinase
MATATRVSLPGKLILIGEHAAVYGRPALVAAVGLRMHVALTPDHTPGVRIDLPQLGYRAATDWAEIRALTDRARDTWERYAASPTPAGFRALREADAADLVKLALGEAVATLDEAPEQGGRCKGLTVSIDSEIPVGAGFGSSAAAAVGVVTACLATALGAVPWDRVQEIALEVERRQHGLPSGIDGATVFHGGVVWAERGADGLAVEPVSARPDLLERLRIFHTGAPGESTGAVVAEVRARRDHDPVGFDEILDRMEWATDELRRLLVDDRSAVAEIARPMRDFQRALEAIGVVPPRVREIVAEIERYGGVAKVSGAGSLTGSGAGCLIVAHPDPEALERIGALAGLEEIPARLGAEGVRLESVS